MDEVTMDAVTDPAGGMARAFHVRVMLCAVWIAAGAAVVAPVRLDITVERREVPIDCASAIGATLGLQGPRPGIDGASGECSEQGLFQVVAAVLVGVAAFAAGRPLLRRYDRQAGIADE
jgi:hypothetical protein